MSKLNIFRKEWLDVVFEDRNKKYGAYKLRSENPRTTTIALFLGISLFSLGISSPLIIKGFEGSLGATVTAPVDAGPVIWDVHPPVAPKKEIPEPKEIVEPAKPAAESAPSSVSTKKHVAYKVTDDASQITEEVTKNSDLIDSDPGSENREAVDGAAVNLSGKVGDGTNTGIGSTETGEGVSSNKVFDFVQVKAEPLGGFTVFNKMFISKFRSPDVGSEVRKIQVIVKFIVEKDGSLSDITVLRDPGYGAGKEALRVLKEMPKWKPAVQNNRKVRSQFTLPITIQVQ